MTHPTLKAMVEAAEKATPGEWRALGGYVTTRTEAQHARTGFGLSEMGQGIFSLHDPYQSVRFHREEDAAFIALANPANILSLAEYVRGLEEKAAAVLKEVTYLSGKYPLEPSLSELEVAASDLRVALGGEP